MSELNSGQAESDECEYRGSINNNNTHARAAYRLPVMQRGDGARRSERLIGPADGANRVAIANGWIGVLVDW
jgi:hypothetical protein